MDNIFFEDITDEKQNIDLIDNLENIMYGGSNVNNEGYEGNYGSENNASISNSNNARSLRKSFENSNSNLEKGEDISLNTKVPVREPESPGPVSQSQPQPQPQTQLVLGPEQEPQPQPQLVLGPEPQPQPVPKETFPVNSNTSEIIKTEEYNNPWDNLDDNQQRQQVRKLTINNLNNIDVWKKVFKHKLLFFTFCEGKLKFSYEGNVSSNYFYNNQRGGKNQDDSHSSNDGNMRELAENSVLINPNNQDNYPPQERVNVPKTPNLANQLVVNNNRNNQDNSTQKEIVKVQKIPIDSFSDTELEFDGIIYKTDIITKITLSGNLASVITEDNKTYIITDYGTSETGQLKGYEENSLTKELVDIPIESSKEFIEQFFDINLEKPAEGEETEESAISEKPEETSEVEELKKSAELSNLFSQNENNLITMSDFNKFLKNNLFKVGINVAETLRQTEEQYEDDNLRLSLDGDKKNNNIFCVATNPTNGKKLNINKISFEIKTPESSPLTQSQPAYNMHTFQNNVFIKKIVEELKKQSENNDNKSLSDISQKIEYDSKYENLESYLEDQMSAFKFNVVLPKDKTINDGFQEISEEIKNKLNNPDTLDDNNSDEDLNI